MQKLKTVDADTLLSTPLPANQFVVERLLPRGLHILAGASKVGKSWLALWLCLCVAKGEPVWGLTTVLYLCLEDSLSRIQGRLFQLTENAPAALHFATMAGNIGKGLEEQIEGFLQMYRDTVLVVIDTLQKVRISNSAANPYANDYQDLSSLKALVLLPVLHLWQEGEGVLHAASDPGTGPESHCSGRPEKSHTLRPEEGAAVCRVHPAEKQRPAAPGDLPIAKRTGHWEETVRGVVGTV